MSKQTAMVRIEQAELGTLCKLAMINDNEIDNKAHGIDHDMLTNFLDRAAAELGYINWVDAYHRIP